MAAPKALRPISFLEAKTIAAERGLIPVIVKGTTRLSEDVLLDREDLRRGGVVRFAKLHAEMDARLDPISWDYFEAVCGARGIGVFESNGWMRLKRVTG